MAPSEKDSTRIGVRKESVAELAQRYFQWTGTVVQGNLTIKRVICVQWLILDTQTLAETNARSTSRIHNRVTRRTVKKILFGVGKGTSGLTGD